MTGPEGGPKIGYLAGELPATDVRALESLGADSLWTAGHIATGGPDPEAVTALTRLGVLTEHCTVGTAIVLLPLYQPVVVAKQFAEIDRLTAGRVVVGIGVGGEFASEFDACGIPIRERGRRTDEAIAVARQLWSGDAVSFDGEFSNFAGVRLCPPPVRRGGPPIVVGGRTDAAWRRAARLGDGWLPFLMTARRYGEQAERLREDAAGQGRDLEGFHWMNEVLVAVGPDVSKARAAAMEEMASRDHPLPEELFNRLCAVGPAEAVAEHLQAHLDAGARHLVLAASPQRETVRMAEVLAADVLPKLTLRAR